MELIIASKPYTREEVSKDTKSMYIFTDNTDRDSGKNIIGDSSWYSQKYGVGKHHPNMTSAVIRGLDNAFPITTQHWYNKDHKGVSGRWNDSDFDEFKEVIDDDFKTIIESIGKGYERVIFPGMIFYTKISNISKERVPKLYSYLMNKFLELKEQIKKL